MSETIKNKIQLKRGQNSPGTILSEGEPGYDLKNRRLYIGNGGDDSVLPTCFPNSEEVVFQGEDAEDGGSVIIDADRLNGHPASDFASAGLVSGGFQATATGQIASELLNCYYSMKDLTIMQVYIEVESNGLELSGGRWMATIYRQHGSLAVVKALDLINGYERQTTITNGVVGEWEWVNPPISLGVEYPTVERYSGKRVYTKAIDFGSMPNASVKQINHNIANLGACISAVGTTSDGNTFGYFFPLYNSNAVNGQVGIYVTKGAIQVSVTANWTGYNATIILKYTKTTD